MKINPVLKKELKKYLQNKLAESKKQITIFATYQLSDDEISFICQKLSLPPDLKKEVIVDKEIIAGLKIRFNSKLIDLSLSSLLKTLSNKLYDLN